MNEPSNPMYETYATLRSNLRAAGLTITNEQIFSSRANPKVHGMDISCHSDHLTLSRREGTALKGLDAMCFEPRIIRYARPDVCQISAVVQGRCLPEDVYSRLVELGVKYKTVTLEFFIDADQDVHVSGYVSNNLKKVWAHTPDDEIRKNLLGYKVNLEEAVIQVNFDFPSMPFGELPKVGESNRPYFYISSKKTGLLKQPLEKNGAKAAIYGLLRNVFKLHEYAMAEKDLQQK